MNVHYSQAETFYSFPQAEHGKIYASKAEELYRSKVFKENAIMIARHNERFARGEVSYTVGVHKHADLVSCVRVFFR